MAEKEIQDDELVSLATFANALEGQMVHELLSNNGIACFLQGANFGALDPLPMRGGYSEIRLLVARRDLARAQELYEAFFAGAGADAEGDGQGSA